MVSTLHNLDNSVTVSSCQPFFNSKTWARGQEHLWDKVDRMRNSRVFGPMVHELFNEDLGNLTWQLKGPDGLQQLVSMTFECTWPVSAISWLYGG